MTDARHSLLRPLHTAQPEHLACRTARREQATAFRQRGGTILGFLAGLVVGLVVAVVVAIFITRAPVPFVNKAGKGSERVIEPKAGAAVPDPNQGLNSKSKPSAGAEKPSDKGTDAASKGSESSTSVLGNVFNNGQQADKVSPPAAPVAPTPSSTTPSAPANSPAPSPVKPVTPVGPGAAPSSSSAPTADNPEDKTTYIIQAGAFRVQEDAEAMKVKLALAGYEARVLTADVNGQPLYRVRLSPYKVLDDVNKAKAKLAENGIESTVIRMK
jgi:cell division protein FtsN